MDNSLEPGPDRAATALPYAPTRNGLRGAVVLIVATLLLAGCSTFSGVFDDTEPQSAEAIAEAEAVNDPLEPLNRFIFELNRGLDHIVLRPTAWVYRAVLPAFAQDAVENFLHNLNSPIIFLNDVLQGEGGRAGDTLTRFVINSTIGIAGLADPASSVGFARHDEDFGQTLGVWGVNEGPYIMLPIFGPSNPRDALGRVVDHFTDPIGYWANQTTWVDNDKRDWIQPTRSFVERVDWRARHMEEVDDLERTSLDYYAAVRNLYRQHRADQIRNDKVGDMPEINALPTMEDFDNMDGGNSGSAEIGQ